MDPAADGGLVAFDGVACRQLRTPAQLMQQPPDMIDVIVHAKASLHDLGHARTSPQIGVKAGRLRAFKQQRFEPALVLSCQLGGTSRRRLGPHSSLAASSRGRLPAPHAAPIHTDAPRYFRGQQSLFEQRQRAQAPALQFLLGFRSVSSHTSDRNDRTLFTQDSIVSEGRVDEYTSPDGRRHFRKRGPLAAT